MNILQKVKRNIEEKDSVDKTDEDQVEEIVDVDYITLEDKKFVRCVNMDKIRNGNFGLFPLECLLNQYVLKDGINCYYVGLDDEKGGNSFEIYEFEYSDSEHVEYRKYCTDISGEDYLHFLVERVMSGFDIFV